ncbi:MAG: Rieske (2Fe-2S) protein [Thainema sp.]
MEIFYKEWSGPESNTLEKAWDTTQPVPGRWYLVRTVLWSSNLENMPVYFEPHDDGNSEGLHIHFDVRFMSLLQCQDAAGLKPEYRYELDFDPVRQQNLIQANIRYWAWGIRSLLLNPDDSLLIEWRPVQCRLSRFPERWRYRWFGDVDYGLEEDAKIQNGICPHRGFDLSSVKPDSRGVIECPMHGATFCPLTGKYKKVPQSKLRRYFDVETGDPYGYQPRG